jgi:SAM-dependent methyltransferase
VQAFDDDLCLSFFGRSYRAGLFEFPQGARVLEVGCAEADWSGPMKTLRPDLHITSLDVRKAAATKSDCVIQGDVLTYDFPPARFDAIVSVSTIEHIGLGAYGDPTDNDGDIRAMQRCRAWLRPDGWMYFDVPYGDTYGVHKNYRRYDEAALQSRLLTGWRETARMRITVDHPDSPYIALTVTPA